MNKLECSLNISHIKSFNEVVDDVIEKEKPKMFGLGENSSDIERIRCLVDEYRNLYKILEFMSYNHDPRVLDLSTASDEIIFNFSNQNNNIHSLNR